MFRRAAPVVDPLDDPRRDQRPARRTGHALPPASYGLLDTRVDGFTLATFLDHLRAAVRAGHRHVIANHNVNSLALFRRSAPFRRFYEHLADVVVVDGMAVVAIARALGRPLARHHRVAVLDWIHPVCALARRERWHLLHLGGRGPTMERARERLTAAHPGLRLTLEDGYFDARKGSAENDEVLRRVREADPDVLLLGMGMPRQEVWLLENHDELPECTVITVGGIFGYLGGDRPTCPRWLGQVGLEWLFRVATEPRRLWRRYLVEPLPLVPPVLRAAIRERRAGRGSPAHDGAPIDLRPGGSRPGAPAPEPAAHVGGQRG